jgi:hypothetical protein
LDGDEALLGIQAEHIMQGQRPIYFYGIPYFGSFEAYVAACLFALFGPSVAVLRLETTIFGLVLVCLTWWLADLLATAAHLPGYARRLFILSAALVASLPPLYDGIIELRTGGGWIESFVLMMLLLICVLRLTTRWQEGASTREQAWRWAGIGFVVGFAMWIYPLVTVSILASTLWILLDRSLAAWHLAHASVAVPLAIWRAFRRLWLVSVAVPTCLLGFLPGLIWGAANQWANLAYIFALGGGWNMQRLRTIKAVAILYRSCVAPRVIGGATPMESPFLLAIHSPLLLFGLGCILASLALMLASLIWQRSWLACGRRLVALPLLFGASSAVLYCTSSASSAILLNGCQNDFGGRYASPLVMALPFFLATVFTLAAMLWYGRGQQARAVEQTAGNWSDPRLLVPCVVLCAYLGGQAVTYGLTNPDEAFQSAYCTIAPANYAPILAYMEREHIQFAWATNLLANPISFETNNRIIMADPLVLQHPSEVINRIPSYTSAVARTQRASFLVFVKAGEVHPALLRALDALHVTYKAAFFPSQPGVDVLVVTPLNRTVSPLESPRLDIFYCKVS